MNLDSQPKNVIILGIFNEISRISRCIESLENQNVDFICIVSDNKSNDGTYEYLNDRLIRDIRFHLIQPRMHRSQHENFEFAVNYALLNIKNIKYMMNFAGDDELLNSNYLQCLDNWLDSNPTYQAVSPTILNYSFKFKTYNEINPKLLSRLKILRVLKFSTQPSSSGFINVVNGLMHKHSYVSLMSSLFSFGKIEASYNKQRQIGSEFISYLGFVLDNRIGNCDDVKLLKEIHNRQGHGNRIDFINIIEQKTSIFGNFKHQLLSQLLPLKALIFFKSYLKWNRKIYFFLFASLFFITNITSIFLKKFKKLFKFN
jgi:glycosyltransferase involved in cell wall biosynthesis